MVATIYPDWSPPDPFVMDFRERVEEATEAPAWVADGNYSEVRDIVWGRADTLIWLDYPLHVSLRRLVPRTLRRALTGEELWSGNREPWTNL